MPDSEATNGRPPTLHERITGKPWDTSYQGLPPPWDLGRPHTPVIRLADEGAFHGRVLDVGCGTGENALELGRRGLDVCGVDVAETAIAQARAKAESHRITVNFVVADSLELGRLGTTFQTVLDCGLFHTFDDHERVRYVGSLASVLAPGGIVHLLCFSDAVPGNGGPRHVGTAELRGAFADGWRVTAIDPVTYETRVSEHGSPGWLARFERT